jgi:hypothetical protein
MPQVVLITCWKEVTSALGMADIYVGGEGEDESPQVLKECVEEAFLHRFVLDLKQVCLIPCKRPFGPEVKLIKKGRILWDVLNMGCSLQPSRLRLN